MHLTKHHGLGNDFLITFTDAVPVDANSMAVKLCDRYTGVGADGLIFGIDSGSTVGMHLFNSDGSTAEISGNGARCLLQAIAMRRGVSDLEVDLETPAGLRQGTLTSTDDSLVADASIDMGAVSAGDEPSSSDFLDAIAGLPDVEQWSTAAVGNPHVVISVPDPAAVDLTHVGPQIESFFPNGVNAHMVSVVGPDELLLHVWERGAGITQACGSGATVSAQRFYEWGLVGERVKVNMPGGSAVVDVANSPGTTAVLNGATTFVGSIEVPHG